MPYSRACNASDELSRGRSGWLTDNILYSTARHIDDLTACDGIKFWMSDGERPVLCRVSHEALRDLADRVHFGGSDEKVFEAYRELIEQVASDAYDAGTSVDEFGLVLVTSEALARVGRSA